jgi:hypothetical protein
MIDCKLSWHNHLLYVCNKVNKGLGMLKRCYYIFPRSCLLSLYYAFVYPFITNGIEFWGQAADYRLKPVRIAQKSCIRIIGNANARAHCLPIAKRLNLLLLDELYKYCLLIHMFNVYTHKACRAIGVMFVRLYEIHTRVTRGFQYDFFVPRCITTSRQQFIVYQGSVLWNALSVNIKMSTSVNNFKRQLRTHLFSNYV